jgi:hypothetical protein
MKAAWPAWVALEEEARANMWRPHVSGREERRRRDPKAQSKEENAFE